MITCTIEPIDYENGYRITFDNGLPEQAERRIYVQFQKVIRTPQEAVELTDQFRDVAHWLMIEAANALGGML